LRVTRLQLGCIALVIAGALPLIAAVRQLPTPLAVSVMDWADLLGVRERSAVADYRDRLREDYDIDYRLVTAGTAGDANWASHEAFAALGVGERSGNGRGLLLVIDSGADRARLEVAAPLEDVFNDAFVTDLEQRQMAPFFREGRVADGIVAATELIVIRAEAAAAGKAFDPNAAAPLGRHGAPGPAAGPEADPAEEDPALLRLGTH
jgi:uncharacterized membrane protein YgcG